MSAVLDSVDPGDFVLYSPHPGHPHRQPALVAAVGNDSLEVLVFIASAGGVRAQPKSGVRHENDPIFSDPVRLAGLMEDGDSGCFVLHPKMQLLETLAAKVLGGQEKPAKVRVAPEPVSNTSFRTPLKGEGEEDKPLTEAQKAERKALLASLK